MSEEELHEYSPPLKVYSVHDGGVATVIGFSSNDPLGVGQGLGLRLPTVYFRGGGWCLLSDLLKHWRLPLRGHGVSK